MVSGSGPPQTVICCIARWEFWHSAMHCDPHFPDFPGNNIFVQIPLILTCLNALTSKSAIFRVFDVDPPPLQECGRNTTEWTATDQFF